MKNTCEWVTLVCGLILALGAVGLEAQQAPPAKKVWTNNDFRKRPALKEEIRTESGSNGESGDKPESKKEAALKEAFEELDAREARAQSGVDWLQRRREELLAEIHPIEKKRDAAPTQREQLAIHAQVGEKRKELLRLDHQLMMDRAKLGEIQRSKKGLLPQPESENYGVRMPPEEKEGKQQAWPEPPPSQVAPGEVELARRELRTGGQPERKAEKTIPEHEEPKHQERGKGFVVAFAALGLGVVVWRTRSIRSRHVREESTKVTRRRSSSSSVATQRTSVIHSPIPEGRRSERLPGNGKKVVLAGC